MSPRKQILLRLDASVHDALARWAGDELRSTTAQIEYVLRQALAQAGRLPDDVGKMPRRGRPPKGAAAGEAAHGDQAGDEDGQADRADQASPGPDQE
ncbi:conserved hypothetical protein [Catenulispora acidiphila DSM 44928]|uniref:Uncharacterized protein n=1 Tax=Catenulispora acidiphila (strain DSM 44928 / JCM 14897 / NBRC 102108 / NRRL B-24433 / ID139908) TaxID=479433 RepID=C7QEF2_CATAD|nr:hypothetical protein [Catenulispora acidiphila]ACU70843.1 conserved hypothetical protein [Catenulispora acidiphila DSM 44928]